MSPAKSFRDLIVWQKAHAFVLEIYRISEGFPKSETYGLTSQLRRAAVSIPANIVERFRKRGTRDKVRFFNIAQGSAEEVGYYLILINDLKYAETTQLQLQHDEVSRLLQAYIDGILRSTRKVD
ncbi:MAG: four helix bundle protein [Planctomycetaceae bacterium]|nr:four helix bundle protein [Planctomycetaceae bacterium]